MSLSADDLVLRHRTYTSFAVTGRPPEFGDDTAAGLRRLHDAHALVLDEVGSIRMALPFSAVATPFRVVAGDVRWWANCAWDALAIPILLGLDATLDAHWDDTGGAVDLAVDDNAPTATDGFVHFAIPAARWWDDIVET